MLFHHMVAPQVCRSEAQTRLELPVTFLMWRFALESSDAGRDTIIDSPQAGEHEGAKADVYFVADTLLHTNTERSQPKTQNV